MTVAGSEGGRPTERLLLAALLIAFTAVVVRFAWTGFVVSDGGYYVMAAKGWLDQFPYVADHFGKARVAVAVPIAVMFALFGRSEAAALASTEVYFVATVVTTYVMLIRILGCGRAFLAALGLATLPVLALMSTIPSADVPELFFVVVSFWLFWAASERPDRSGLALTLAGVAAGLAFSAREVSAGLMLFYGLLFLTRYRMPRARYLLIAAGFAGVIALECLYYVVMVGNPLQRWTLLLAAASVHDRVYVGVFELAAGGTIHIWEPIDPLVMFFTKHSFGLLGYLAVPALFWAWGSARRDMGAPARLTRLMSVLAAVWIVFAAVLLKNMVLMPRYYMVPAYALYVAAAIWMLQVLAPRRKTLVAVLCCAFLLTNAAAIAVDNKNPRFGERALVSFLQDHPGAVVTDPLTANDVQWYCEFQQVDCSGVQGRRPKPGDSYFYNPRNADRPNRFVPAAEVSHYRPAPDWPTLWSKSGPPPALAELLTRLGLDAVVPPALSAKLLRQRDAVSVHLVVAGPGTPP